MPNADHIQISVDNVNINATSQRIECLCDSILKTLEEIRTALGGAINDQR